MTEAAATQPSTEPGPATPDQPVRGGDRLVTLDLIRGVAVLGILFANITAFGQSSSAYWWPPAIEGGANAADKAIWLFQLIFVDHKFRGLFSLLFGAGIYLFLERAWARGAGRWLQARRLAWLLAFGLAHYFLVWTGDILAAYAVTGFWSLLFVKRSIDSQWRWGISLYIAGLIFFILTMGSNYLAATNPAVQAQLTEEQRSQITGVEDQTLDRSRAQVELLQDGSYLEIVAHTAEDEADELITKMFVAPLTETLGLMLIGMALYRRGFFSGAYDPLKMKRWGWIGVLGGLALTVPFALWPYAADFPFFMTTFSFNGLARIGQLPMVLGLAALLVVGTPRLAATALGSRFVAAGRMAFSNYLGTSILLMFVFHGWALGYLGRLHRPELLLVLLAVWAVMLLWSKPWLARFRYGPFEWLWRCLTYGRLFPLRR